MIHLQRLFEARRFRHRGNIESMQPHLNRSREHPCRIQHVLQPHTFPASIAHRAVAPLPAGNSRLEQAAGIAGTLVQCHQRDRLELRLQIVQRQAQRLAYVAADLQSEGPQVHCRGNSREVPAHEEGVVWSEIVAKVAQRRFQLRRTIGQQNELRFLRIFHSFESAGFPKQGRCIAVSRQKLRAVAKGAACGRQSTERNQHRQESATSERPRRFNWLCFHGFTAGETTG